MESYFRGVRIHLRTLRTNCCFFLKPNLKFESRGQLCMILTFKIQEIEHVSSVKTTISLFFLDRGVQDTVVNQIVFFCLISFLTNTTSCRIEGKRRNIPGILLRVELPDIQIRRDGRTDPGISCSQP